MTKLSKYSNLPDVDVDSPDTFENTVSSHPLQEATPDAANEDVETGPLNVKSATSTFKEKEKKSDTLFVWNNESKAQKLHFLSLQLFNLREQLQDITQDEDGSDSVLSKIRSLESEIQSAIVEAAEKKNNSLNFLDVVTDIRDSLPQKSSEKDGPLMFELYSKPGKITDSEQFLDLEARVSRLEKVLGASIYQPHVEFSDLNIIKTLRTLTSHVNILTDTQVQDQTIKKLESLKLDKSFAQNSEKIEAIHSVISSEYMPMIPQILSRLVTLKETHDHSIHLIRRFKELEKTLEGDHQIITKIQKEMKTFDGIIQENSKDMKDNISTIMTRFKDLEGRIEKLMGSK